LQLFEGMEPQIGLFMPILLGTDGKVKMSKSIGNYVGLNEPADVMYHKIYSLADSIVENWFELLTNIPLAEIKQMMADIAAGKMNPNDAKHRLAIDIVTQYYGAEAAEAAAAKEREIHSGNAIPSDAAECSVDAGAYGALDLLVNIKAFASKGEARRMVQNGGVKIRVSSQFDLIADVDNRPVLKQIDNQWWEWKVDINDVQNVFLNVDGPMLIQVGKRKFFKVNF